MKRVNVYLQFHSVIEPSKDRDIWIQVLFGYLYGIELGSVQVLAMFLLSGSVSGKPWVLILFVLAGFWLFPISD